MAGGDEPKQRLERVVPGSGSGVPVDRPATGALTPELAAQVSDPGLGWLPLPVRGDLPLSAEELLRLVRLHARETPEHRRRRRQAFPPEESVPTEEQVRALADRVTRSDLAARQLEPRLRDVLDRPDAGAVLAAIQEVKARLGEVLRHRRAWVVRVADLALGDPDGEAWRRVCEQTGTIERLLDLAVGLGDTVVEGVVPSEEALQVFGALQGEAAAGQPARRWFRGRTQRAAARLLDKARVDGERVTDATGASAVRRFLEVATHAAALERELVELGVPVPAHAPRDAMIEGLSDVRDALRSIARLVEASRRLVRVLGPGPAGLLPVASLEEAERVQWAGDALAAVRDGEQARRDLGAAARALEQAGARMMATEDLEQPAPEVAELVLCLRAAEDVAYAEWLVKLRAGRRARRLAVQREELLARLAEGAPGLPALIEADATEATWAPRIARWAEAWKSARAASETTDTTPARVVALPEQAGPPGPRELILELTARGPVSGAEVRAATGLNATRSRALLKQLVDAGELVRTGATSATRWHRADHEDQGEP